MYRYTHIYMHYVIYYVDVNNGSPLPFLSNYFKIQDIQCGAGILTCPPPPSRETMIILLTFKLHI